MARTPRVLFVATVEIHILTFHLPYLQYFNEQGYEVHVACAGEKDIPYCHVRHTVPFQRSPFRPSNVQALFALKKIIDSQRFTLVHCHTPVGGVIGRLASITARRKGTRVLYTAHGFQFFKGGPVKDWLIYATIERMMARFTDVLITVNQEDYDTAVHRRFKAGLIRRINGIGLDASKFQLSRREAAVGLLKKNLGLQEEDIVLLCVGELNKNKNQAFLLEIIRLLCEAASSRASLKLLLVGPDSLNGALQKKAADLGVAEKVLFLGYRRDIPVLMAAADIAVSASRREGLPFNILEAMSAGKPVVVTDIRGHRDLVSHGVNGFLVKPHAREAFADAVKRLCGDEALRRVFGAAGAAAARDFALPVVLAQMKEIYNTVCRA